MLQQISILDDRLRDESEVVFREGWFPSKFQDKKHLRPVEPYEIAGLVAFGEKNLLTRSPAIYQ